MVRTVRSTEFRGLMRIAMVDRARKAPVFVPGAYLFDDLRLVPLRAPARRLSALPPRRGMP